MSEIVVIEEDKLMRGLLAEWLSAEGYSVRAAASGGATPQDRTDLVIVDVYMPRHEGAEKLRAVKVAHPERSLSAAHATPEMPATSAAVATMLFNIENLLFTTAPIQVGKLTWRRPPKDELGACVH